MPMSPLCTVPYCLRSATTLFIIVVGIANPYPVKFPVCEYSMALMPISSPLALTSAPPEFPAFMAASVCMKASTPLAPNERALADTIPAVTVARRLKGWPMARTHSPTFISSDDTTLMAGRLFPFIFIRARSVDLSVPMMRAENSRLSFSVTVSSSAPSTTWLFVTIYPSELMMTPEPVPSRFGVWTFRFWFWPCPLWPKNPKGSNMSPKGSPCISTSCTFEFCRYLICATHGRARSAATVRSTG